MTEPVELSYAEPDVIGEPPIRHQWWLFVTTVLCLTATAVPLDGDDSILSGLVDLLLLFPWANHFDMAVLIPPVALPVLWSVWMLRPWLHRRGIVPRIVAMAVAGLLTIGPMPAVIADRSFYGPNTLYFVGLDALCGLGLTMLCIRVIRRSGWRTGVLAMFLSAYCVAVGMLAVLLLLVSNWRAVSWFSISLAAVISELLLLWRSAVRTFPR